jgi:hypothetical protein
VSTPESESVTPPGDALDVAIAAGSLGSTPATLARVRAAVRQPKWSGRLATLDTRWSYPLAVYLLSRVLYLGTALVATLVPQPLFGHHWNGSLTAAISNWDGIWYLATAAHGYPSHIDPLHYSTVGFFPLYPILMWALGQALSLGYVWSGLIVSLAFGAVATILIGRLAERWFGPAAGRRTIAFVCLFPGTIVFSMDYTEGLLLTCVAGAMLAVEHRRWLLAGLLAGVATAVGPVAVAILPASVAVCAHELRRGGWRDGNARRSMLMPLLAPLGIVAFGAYLWARVGSPFASFTVQRDAWQNHSGPLALYFRAHGLFEEIFGSGHGPINPNAVLGLLGAVFLAWGLVHLWRARDSVPVVASVWTVGVAVLTVTSDQVPPNPRMLLCAFPLLIVLAARIEGRAWRRMICVTAAALIVLSPLTFIARVLRP